MMHVFYGGVSGVFRVFSISVNGVSVYSVDRWSIGTLFILVHLMLDRRLSFECKISLRPCSGVVLADVKHTCNI